jgi:hypothetical protein
MDYNFDTGNEEQFVEVIQQKGAKCFMKRHNEGPRGRDRRVSGKTPLFQCGIAAKPRGIKPILNKNIWHIF